MFFSCRRISRPWVQRLRDWFNNSDQLNPVSGENDRGLNWVTPGHQKCGRLQAFRCSEGPGGLWITKKAGWQKKHTCRHSPTCDKLVEKKGIAQSEGLLGGFESSPSAWCQTVTHLSGTKLLHRIHIQNLLSRVHKRIAHFKPVIFKCIKPR